MRLRGPWIVRGSIIDTSISSQSGTILPNGQVNLVMNDYTFFPATLHRLLLTHVRMCVPLDFIFPLDVEIPQLQLWNGGWANAPYEAAWRHISP